MKPITVSIVTWLGNGNYGTALQAFALRHKVELLGYDAQLLEKVGVVRSIKETLGKILGKKKPLHGTPTLDKFWERYGNVRRVYSILPKCKLLKETDLFLNGSDQVWNTYFYFDPFYFLSFAKDKRRAAYASSIGTDTVNPAYANKVEGYLSKYSHIGVREESGARALCTLTGRTDIRQVVDPTFLLRADDWKRLLAEADFFGYGSRPYMLVYLIGSNNEYQSKVRNVAETYGIGQVVVVESKESGQIVKGTVNLRDIDPLSFVGLIDGATLVCTDSFHATAISMNLKKPFVVLKRFKDADKASQNSRLYDLLIRYGLEGRLFDHNVPAGSIDYQVLSQKLEDDIRSSEDFLFNEIENR